MQELDNSLDSSGALGAKSIACRVAPPKRGTQSGKSALLWTALLALTAIAVLIWMRVSREAALPLDAHLPPNAAHAQGAAADSPAGAKQPEIPMFVQPALEIGRSEGLPHPVGGVFDNSRLDGRGHIRGHIQAPPGVEFPEEWVLSVGPSTSLIGRERAETRKLEFHAGEQDFDLPDLALGGYMLRASAFGLASSEQHLLLARPAEAEQYVTMQFAVTAFVEGCVRYEDSTPAIGLELSLGPRPIGPRAIAITDRLGNFLFSDVKSGIYTLNFGRAENPVREPIEVRVGTSAERLADTIVPKMCDLIVRVQLSPGVAAAGVKLDGYGDHGGRFSGETNAEGEFRARYLPAGRITVDAVFPDGARVSGREIVSVGVLGLLTLVLHQ